MESKTRKTLHTAIRLDPQSRRNLDDLAVRLERTRSDVIRLLLSRAAELLLDPKKENIRNV
jgi:predicted transcriptional regulator